MKLRLPLADPFNSETLQAAFDQLLKWTNGKIDETNIASGSITPVGAILDWGGSADPAGGHFLLCDGRAINRTTYAALFAILGTTYGTGDGSTTFNIPDLRGRTSVMVDGAAARMASNDALGNSSGEETHALSLGELAAHHHGLFYNTRFIPGNAGLGTFNPFEKDNTGVSDISFDTGSGTAHNNMPPYLVVNKIIRVS